MNDATDPPVGPTTVARITIVVDEAERRAITDAAANLGKTPSGWLKEIALASADFTNNREENRP